MRDLFTVSEKKPEIISKRTFLHPQDMANQLYAADGFKLPGIIETHIHGAFGWDFSFGDPEKISEMLDKMLLEGITGVFPTIISCGEEQRIKALTDIAKAAENRNALPLIHGIYLEGPFLSPKYRGSHPENVLMAPDINLLEKWQKAAGGLIKIITVAPELPGAIEFIKEAVKQGIIVALGHSDADFETTMKAIEAGASHVTHIFNAMRQLHHRDSSMLAAVLSGKSTAAELIADCRHISPEMCRLFFNIYENNQIILVSDSMAAAGLPEGSYNLYGKDLDLHEGRLTLPDGKFFGGAMLLPKCLTEMNKKAGTSWGQLGMSVWRTPCDVFKLPAPETEVFFDTHLQWLASRHQNKWFTRNIG